MARYNEIWLLFIRDQRINKIANPSNGISSKNLKDESIRAELIIFHLSSLADNQSEQNQKRSNELIEQWV
ncbi:MAG: hypothetical protein QF727_03575, partial [Prochlorococcaceae cyanobacterium ETNP14_MAG_4]|jgi:hypothetical protein|nr:hypothetical protein [Prochlorococcaceae cyanobacterium ETNP14_MAG_4]|tara:strand:- start:4067 stop:4276 length:210 start_codon:yes stop_codon:yes gene_type:complete